MRHQPDELFRSTAPYYARYRPGYPAEFFTCLRDRLALDGTQRVLDLGCGTGQIALPIAEHVREVVAVDPEPDMLAEGRSAAAERGTSNIDWRLTDSSRLPNMDIGHFHLATLGASLHWMDRDAVLASLDTIIEPGGAVVVASGGRPDTQEPPPWNEVIEQMRTNWLGPDRRAGSGTYTHPREGHAEVLRRSAFSAVETVDWTWSIERDLDAVVGLQFSFSFSAPALLGEGKEAFEAELRQALTEANPSGVFVEHIRTEALIATRGQGQPT